jgi:parallel beta-helix repeat protein
MPLIGIIVNDTAHGRYHYNTIHSCRGYGIHIRGDNIAKVDTNTIYANGMADVINESQRSTVVRNTTLEVCHPYHSFIRYHTIPRRRGGAVPSMPKRSID